MVVAPLRMNIAVVGFVIGIHQRQVATAPKDEGEEAIVEMPVIAETMMVTEEYRTTAVAAEGHLVATHRSGEMPASTAADMSATSTGH